MKEIKIMIPNRLILNTKDKNTGEIISSVMHETKKKNLIYLHCTLMSIRNKWNNEINTSLNILLDIMTISRRKENVESLKKDLMALIKANMIDLTKKDIKQLKQNDLLRFEYYPIDTDENSLSEKFFTVDFATINKIISIDNKRTYNLLNMYSYLSARSYTLGKNTYYNLFGEYEVCYPSYNIMMDELIMNRNTISSTIKKLTDEGYIYYNNAGKYSYDNKIKTSVNTYILTNKKDYKLQVKNSMQFYREKTAELHNWNWI